MARFLFLRQEKGTQVEHFILEERLGRGTTGEIWRALNTQTTEFVALKFIPWEILGDSSEMSLLNDTFHKLQSLSYEHLANIYDFRTPDKANAYFVLEYIPGVTLYQFFSAHRRAKNLYQKTVFSILEQIASTLDYLHSEGLSHRDIKTENILVITDNGQANGNFLNLKIIDPILGSLMRSMITRIGRRCPEAVNARPYYSPEMWQGRPITYKTDLYALGILAYELISGTLPYDPDRVDSLRDQVLYAAPPLIENVPESVNDVFRVILAKQPEERYSSASEFLQALKNALGDFYMPDNTFPLAEKNTEPEPARRSAVSVPAASSTAPFSTLNYLEYLFLIINIILFSIILWYLTDPDTHQTLYRLFQHIKFS